MCLECHLHWGERRERKDFSWAQQTHFKFSWGSVCIPLAGSWEARSSASPSTGMPWFYSNEPSEGLFRVSAQKGGVDQGQVSLCAGIWLLTPQGGMKMVKYPSILLNIAAELNLKALWSDFHTDFWLNYHFSPYFLVLTFLTTVSTPKPYDRWCHFPH